MFFDILEVVCCSCANHLLQKCQKKKDVMRLRLLLTYVQNGIEEPWQRIASVIAVFAAETSLLLLDPSHDHYTSLSKLLMRSSRVNMKVYALQFIFCLGMLALYSFACGV